MGGLDTPSEAAKPEQAKSITEAREIKFRAWDGKKMVDVPINHSGYRLNELLEGICDNYKLMQYTGLKDKNGREIYEGDILQLKNTKGQVSNHQEVFWDETTASFGWRTANEDSWPDGFTGFYDEYEVVGNIHESPELLGSTE